MIFFILLKFTVDVSSGHSWCSTTETSIKALVHLKRKLCEQWWFKQYVILNLYEWVNLLLFSVKFGKYV